MATDEPIQQQWSRLERQIMDAVYAMGEGGVADVVEHLGEPSAYDSVRVTLGVLERKGYIEHRQEGNRNIYFPTIPTERVRDSAMQQLARTFFGGSPAKAALAFLSLSDRDASEAELEELARVIQERTGEE